jgi:hypothetical protein
MLDDADLHAALFAEFEGLVNGEGGTQVDVIVGHREVGFGRRVLSRGLGGAPGRVKIPTLSQ